MEISIRPFFMSDIGLTAAYNYEVAFASIHSEKLMNELLEVGYISTIEYFMEMNYLNEAFNGYIETEGEYYQAVVALMRYR